MKNIIRGQVAMLLAMAAAFAVTLSACGGGSSSTGGGGSAVKATARVSGVVTNDGIAGLEIRGSRSLFASVSDLFISVARASGIPNVPVSVACAGGDTNAGVTNGEGKFKIDLVNIGSGVCTTLFNDSAAGPEINVAPGMETELRVTLVGDTVSVDRLDIRQDDDDSSTELEIRVDDGQSSDDDSLSSDDASSELSSDDDHSSGNSGSGSSSGTG
jgi:hypothetical protein